MTFSGSGRSAFAARRWRRSPRSPRSAARRASRRRRGFGARDRGGRLRARSRTAAVPPGTVIEVRNLFYNIPVRRTFLKSDMTESGHVVEMFSRIALAHPEVHLTYRSGSKVVYDLPPVPGTRERIAIFFGRELAESLLWVEGQLDDMQLWGYVAHPSQSRSTAKGQFLFLGRPLRPRPLAQPRAQRSLSRLADGRPDARGVPPPGDPPRGGRRQRPSDQDRGPVPRLAAGLQPPALDPAADVLEERPALAAASDPGAGHGGSPASVGVGPARRRSRRVRLRHRVSTAARVEPGAARAGRRPDRPADGRLLVRAERRQAARFRNRSASPCRLRGRSRCRWGLPSGPARRSTNSPPAQPPDTASPHESSHVDEPRRKRRIAAAADAGSADAESFQAPAEAVRPADRSRGADGAPTELRAPRPPSREPAAPLLKAIQVHDSYLIAETGDGMMVIDQHALHERILYEELRSRVARGSDRVATAAGSRAGGPDGGRGGRRWSSRRELLAQLGLEVEPFGGDTVLVRSIPAMLPHVVPERLVRDLAEHLRTQPLPPTRDGLLAELLHMVACKAAVKAGQPLSPAEIDGAPGTPAPRGRLASLPARPADRAGLHQGRPREAVRADLTSDSGEPRSGTNPAFSSVIHWLYHRIVLGCRDRTGRVGLTRERASRSAGRRLRR